MELIIYNLMPYAILAGMVLVILLGLLLIFRKSLMASEGFGRDALTFISRHYLWLGLIVALSAFLGSLFYSEIMLLEPCTLCWYQRALMFPQLIIFGFAIYWRDKSVGNYLIPLSVAGALVAVYHYILQMGFSGSESIFCSQAGGVSCSVPSLVYFGFITIPLMSLVAFGLLIMLGITAKKIKKS